MLTRMMVRFGRRGARRAAAVAQATAPPAAADARARRRKAADGTPQLVVDDCFDRAWRRVGLALDRVGFTVVDRDRSHGHLLRALRRPRRRHGAKDRESGFLSKLDVLEGHTTEKPEQYQIKVVEPPRARNRAGHEGRCPTGPERRAILGLCSDQLRVDPRGSPRPQL